MRHYLAMRSFEGNYVIMWINLTIYTLTVGVSQDDDSSSFDSDIDMSRMRRRFNELLDDALSLYESQRSPHHHHKHDTKKSFDHRSQSAAHFRYSHYARAHKPTFDRH